MATVSDLDERVHAVLEDTEQVMRDRLEAYARHATFFDVRTVQRALHALGTLPALRALPPEDAARQLARAAMQMDASRRAYRTARANVVTVRRTLGRLGFRASAHEWFAAWTKRLRAAERLTHALWGALCRAHVAIVTLVAEEGDAHDGNE